LSNNYVLRTLEIAKESRNESEKGGVYVNQVLWQLRIVPEGPLSMQIDLPIITTYGPRLVSLATFDDSSLKVQHVGTVVNQRERKVEATGSFEHFPVEHLIYATVCANSNNDVPVDASHVHLIAVVAAV
jgi:hypothetical protein